MKQLVWLLLISYLLVACTGVGSHYVAPDVTVPAHWQDNNETVRVQSNEAWWREFHDPVLTTLIEQKSVYNLDLKAAQDRVELAREQYKIASSQLFPVAGIETFAPNGTGSQLVQVIALGALLELDLFGRIRQTKARANDNLDAEQAYYAFSKLNLTADIATTYLKLRQAQKRAIILRKNLQSNQDILLFLKSRYQAGSTSYLNLAQQEALIETQLSEGDQVKALISALIHQLELLTGEPPGKLMRLLTRNRPVPEIHTPIRLGVPSSILSRRPDIVAAERRIAAAHADIRVAIASLFPKISIGWLLGWETETLASNIFAITHPDSTAYGMFNAPLFNLGLYRNLGFKQKEKILAITQYQITIMRALHEVETQHQYCIHYQDSRQHLKRAVAKKQLVLRLATDAYEKGFSDFNTVYHAEEELNRLQMLHLEHVIQYQIARIELYKALGGAVLK
jgi:NodT family efflux transporter outer membrane factor (OMF) lipoprotein